VSIVMFGEESRAMARLSSRASLTPWACGTCLNYWEFDMRRPCMLMDPTLMSPG